MASGIILLLTILAYLPIESVPLPIDPSAKQISESYPSYYIQYRIDKTHHYRPSLVSFLHRQPDGSQLPTVRYYRIVFHCDILPGSLYLRFSRRKPYRTVLLNRRDPSTIFAFRSVGAYSRVQIQSYVSGLWLCMNEFGVIIPKSNITTDNLACTFRQSSDGVYMRLISEVHPKFQVSFNTLRLISMNKNLRRRFLQSNIDVSRLFKQEQCARFIFDGQIDQNFLGQRNDDPKRF